MKKTLIFLCFALSATGAAAQVDGGGISDSMMERIRKGYTATPEQKAVKNALASTSIATLAINSDNLAMCDTHFSNLSPRAVSRIRSHRAAAGSLRD